MRRRFGGLRCRLVLLMSAVVVVAVVVAGAAAVQLTRSVAVADSRAALSRQADLAATVVAARRGGDVGATLRLVRSQRTPVAWTTPRGEVAGDRLARDAWSAMGQPTARRQATLQRDGDDVLVAVRPIGDGRVVVMAQRFRVDQTDAGQVLRGVLVALLVGLIVAVAVGVWFAGRLTRPLREAAAGARRLAGGDRAVRVGRSGTREVAELGAAVDALADSLARSENRERDFLMSVSHELRTPLTAVLGYGESLADGLLDGDAARRAGAVLVSEAGRLARLVDDLLDLARLRADGFHFDLVRTDLRPVIEEAGQGWERRCAAEQIAMVVDVPGAPVLALVDPARLRQVIDNLVENALRVTPVGGSITLRLDAGPCGVRLDVDDTGPGLSPEERAVAFERAALWERSRGVRQVGTGLGLAIVAALVAGMGGRAAAEPGPGAAGT
ncbi:MAG: sensor histidine kinase, partial [Dermatophilaceae bacterium]